MFMLEAEVLHDVEQERRVYKEIACVTRYTARICKFLLSQRTGQIDRSYLSVAAYI